MWGQHWAAKIRLYKNKWQKKETCLSKMLIEENMTDWDEGMIMKVGTVAIKMTQLLVTGCEGGGALEMCKRKWVTCEWASRDIEEVRVVCE